jgi:hypothetical protein
MMKVVSWNCRGLGSREKKRSKKALKSRKPLNSSTPGDKNEGSRNPPRNAKKIWKKGEGKAISSRGASGGLCTIWNTEEFILEDHLQSQFWMMASLSRKSTGKIYTIINVYMPNNYLEKSEA